MQLKVRLKFSDEERRILVGLCRQLDMSVEFFCKKAVALAVNQVFSVAEAMESKGAKTPSEVGEKLSQREKELADEQRNTGNTGDNSQEAPGNSESSASPVLADQGTDATDNRGS